MTGKKDADVELLKFYEDVLPADSERGTPRALPAADPARRAAREAHDGALELRAARRGEDGRLCGRLAMLTLIVSGEYGNVRRFIHQLETAPEFLVLESVSVTTAEDRALNVTARVATSYRASDQWQLSPATSRAYSCAAGAARAARRARGGGRGDEVLRGSAAPSRPASNARRPPQAALTEAYGGDDGPRHAEHARCGGQSGEPRRASRVARRAARTE